MKTRQDIKNTTKLRKTKTVRTRMKRKISTPFEGNFHKHLCYHAVHINTKDGNTSTLSITQSRHT